MFCRNCGNEMDSNAAVCVKCGFKKGQGDRFCQNCGKETQSGQSVCLGCGFKLDGGSISYRNGAVNSDGSVPEDKRVICAVLALLFSFGVHNFILGETKKGILKIVLTVLVFTWIVAAVLSLIDAIKLFMRTYEVDIEKYI